jgi:hypothetical protein
MPVSAVKIAGGRGQENARFLQRRQLGRDFLGSRGGSRGGCRQGDRLTSGQRQQGEQNEK